MRLIFGVVKLAILVFILSLIFHDQAAKLYLTAGLRWVMGVPVTIENAKVDLWSTQIKLTGLHIPNPSSFPDGTLANVPKVFIDFEASSLWEGRPHFDTIEIDCKDLRIVRDTDGRVNLLSLKVFQSSSATSERGEDQKSKLIRFHVDNLILSFGFATYTDLSGGSPLQRSFNLRLDHAVYRNIESVGDIIKIIGWETLKRMGISGIDGILGQIREELTPALGPKNLLEKAITAFKNF